MSNEMIERVAKAIWDLEQKEISRYGFSSNLIMFGIKGPVSWEYINDYEKVIPSISESFRMKARAAIEAMREPTEAMLEATDPIDRNERQYALETWQFMIDEALR